MNPRGSCKFHHSNAWVTSDPPYQAELGVAELHNTGLYWPDDAICMTLNNVGSNAGPDLSRLQSLMQLNLARKKPANLYAAGGVRNIDDLIHLKQLGVAGALVASALHSGEISAQDLSLF